MDEQFVIHPYSEIPFRNKNNEQVIYATTCINLKGVNLSKKKKVCLKRLHILCIHSHGISEKKKLD